MGQGKWYLAFAGIIVLALIGFYFFSKTSKTYVLGEKITITPSPSPIVTQSPSPTQTESPTPQPTEEPSPSPIPTSTPKPQPTPSPVPPSEINSLIDRFSAQYSVDANVMRHIAICESGFNPNAHNGPYLGLYQFAKTTWQNLRKEVGEDPNHELRLSAEEASQTAAYALSKGKRGLWPNCAP